MMTSSATTRVPKTFERGKTVILAALKLVNRRPRLTVALAMVASTVLTWGPFLATPNVLYRYWDGPHYAYLAKTLYEVPADRLASSTRNADAEDQSASAARQAPKTSSEKNTNLTSASDHAASWTTDTAMRAASSSG